MTDSELHGARGQSGGEPPTATDRKVVLAIDEEADSLSSLMEALCGAGYDGHACGSYDEALVIALRTHPDLIICNQTIAQRSGAELCHDIRAALKRQSGPHVIVLSRSQTPDIIRRTDSGQGAYYLRKPFDAAVLLKLIKCAV